MNWEQADSIYTCSKLNCYGASATEVKANSRAVPIYQGIFILAQGFQLVLSFDSVLNSSVMQLLSTTVFNIALFGYSIIQWTQGNTLAGLAKNTAATIPGFVAHKSNLIELVIIGLMAIYSILWVIVTIRLYKVFGWSIFKELGADIAVRRRLTLYYIYVMLLKLDTFFFVGFLGQYLLLVLITPEADGGDSKAWIYGGVSLPLSIILLAIAYYAIRRESNILMTLVLIGLSGVMGFLVTRLVDIFVNTTRYIGSKNSLTFFALITILLCLSTFVIAVLNFRNFGKGLIDQLKSRGNPKGHLQLDDMGRGQSQYINNENGSKWPVN
ncbi:hypothetical protein HK096_005680 [Nowakowskiella sp. JEL0078]|nr:hypothetical protein HK096_005680 [Nowakowskiella sp. JEL0078]